MNKITIYRKKPAISYPGSLLQQNHGEELNHGYLLWNIKSNKNRFIKINNDYGYYTLDIKTTNLKKIKEIPKKCKLRLNIYFSDISVIRDIIRQIKSLYNPLEITINRINDKNIKSKIFGGINSVGDVYDIHYQNKLLREYLNEINELDENIIDEILKINKEINSSINLDSVVKNIRWTPIKFEWSNMFSYSEKNIIDFTNLKGIIGLFSPNKTGKTAAIDSLIFCLFDKTSKDLKTIDIINNKKNNFDCLFEFELNSTHYFIHRYGHKNKKGNLMYHVDFWYIDNLGKKISLNGDNRWGTNLNIKNIIGSYNDFILTSLSTQINNTGFIDKGNTDRKDLIIQFIGLGIYDLLYDKASIKYKDLNSEIKILENSNNIDYDIELENLKKTLEKNNQLYETLLKNKEELIKDKTNIEKDINKHKDKIIKNIDETLDINKLIELLIKYKDKLFILNKKEKELSKLKTDLDGIYYDLEKWLNSYDDKEYKELLKLKDDHKNVTTEISKLNENIKNKKDKQEKLLKLEYDPNCMYCMNNIFVKDAIKAKEELIDDNKKIEILKNKSDKLFEKISSLGHVLITRNTYDDYKKEYQDIKVERLQVDIEYSKILSDINIVDKNIQDTNNNISLYDKTKKDIELNKNYTNIINDLVREKEMCELKINTLNDEILNIYGTTKIYETKIINIENNIKKLESLLIKKEQYDYYLNSIKRDGIPYKLILNIIPKLENEINNILHQIVDFSILINLDENKNINIQLVYDDLNYWPLESASGMEKFISSIAIRTALINISNLPRPNFLIIDEGFGTLDAENLNSVSTLLDYLKTNFDFIIVISHVDQIRDVADSYIDVKSHYGFSYINHT